MVQGTSQGPTSRVGKGGEGRGKGGPPLSSSSAHNGGMGHVGGVQCG
jgi:hypothetical protein